MRGVRNCYTQIWFFDLEHRQFLRRLSACSMAVARRNFLLVRAALTRIRLTDWVRFISVTQLSCVRLCLLNLYRDRCGLRLDGPHSGRAVRLGQQL